MTLAATPIYAGLLALIYVGLSFWVIFGRRNAKANIGDGGDKDLSKRIRVHGNFVEYAPFGLLLLLMAELQGAPLWVVHGLGLLLLVGRLAHVIGMGSTPQIFPLRQLGMVATFTMITISALAAIAHAVI